MRVRVSPRTVKAKHPRRPCDFLTSFFCVGPVPQYSWIVLTEKPVRSSESMPEIAACAPSSVVMYGMPWVTAALRMGLESSCDFLPAGTLMIRSMSPSPKVIFITAYDDGGKTKARLLKMGAYACLDKPIGSLKDLEGMINKASEK